MDATSRETNFNLSKQQFYADYQLKKTYAGCGRNQHASHMTTNNMLINLLLILSPDFSSGYSE